MKKRFVVKASVQARKRRVIASVDYGTGPHINEQAIVREFQRIAERCNWAREDRDMEPLEFSVSSVRLENQFENGSVAYSGIITDSEGNSINCKVIFLQDNAFGYDSPNYVPYRDIYDDSEPIREYVLQYIQVAGLPDDF